MKLSVINFAAALLVVFGLSTAKVAAQAKPVLVVSISGVDEILGDVGFLTELAGSAPIGQMAAMMANQYVQGLDRKKPITIVVNAEGGELQPMGIIPVTDLPRFLDNVGQAVGEIQKAGDGVYELSTPIPTYIKEQGGYAYVGQTPNSLSRLPANPAGFAAGLDKDYDIGIRAHIKNVPAAYKELAIEKIKEGVAQQLENAADLDTEEAELQRKLVQANVNQWESMMNEVDTITVGWLVDSQGKTTSIDAMTTAIPGTKMARQMAALKDMKSGFGGFVMPGAAVTVNAVGEMTEADIEQLVAMVKPISDSAKKEIDKDNDLPDDEARTAAKKLIDQMFAILEETVREGKVDLGATMMLEDKTMSAMAGFSVADGSKVEQAIRDLADLAEKDAEFPGIKFDAAKDGDIRFHTVSMPVGSDEFARTVFGGNLDVVVGIGAKAAYLGFGEDCLAGLQRAIRSSASSSGTAPPMRMNIALAPILEFASNFEDNPMVSALADTLKDNRGRDNVVITSTAIPNGARYRIEVQEGVLKSIGEATAAGVR